MTSVFHKVLTHEELIRKPPILIDIGASGAPPIQWKVLSKYSTCIAFDADERDFSILSSDQSNYKKLFCLNRLIAASSSHSVNFYLTRFPHCSSTLHPDAKGLMPWAFKSLFEVDKVVKMPAIDINSALSMCGIEYIDWYKTDSQGTDLRIFSSLKNKYRDRIIVAEFEPGILDAYLGEDKLHQVMSYMNKKNFWISSMSIKGSQRIYEQGYNLLNFVQKRYLDLFLKSAPGWCEISYINKFNTSGGMQKREYLLGWLFSTIKEEHGFALNLAQLGEDKFGDPLFKDLRRFSINSLSKGYSAVLARAIKKIFRWLCGIAK